jgi:hypothetical protein
VVEEIYIVELDTHRFTLGALHPFVLSFLCPLCTYPLYTFVLKIVLLHGLFMICLVWLRYPQSVPAVAARKA